MFGIDINDLSLKLVKLEKNKGDIKLASFNLVRIKPGVVKEGVIQDKEALIKVIKFAAQTVEGKEIDTKYAVVCLPEEKSFSQVIQMPKMTEKELREAVPFEAENYIPLPIDKVYLDFQVIEPQERQDHLEHLQLLINAAPKSIVDSYIDCFKKAGFIPSVLEVESQSIARALLKNGKGAEPVILIDFGETKSSFVIFSNNSIRFTSTMPISSQRLTEAISQKLGVGLQKAEELKIKYGLAKNEDKKYNIAPALTPIIKELAVQIKKYINFYQSHASQEYFFTDLPLEKIILCGGGANLKKMPEFLEEELKPDLKVQVQIGDPLLNIVKQRNGAYVILGPKLLSFTTALGAALRGLNSQH